MERISTPTREKREEMILNQAVSYMVVNEGDISIHVAEISALSLRNKLQLIRQGFQHLAHALDNDTALVGVRRITATSWIVDQNPQLLTMLGFTIEKDSDDSKKFIDEYESGMSNIVFTKETEQYLRVGFSHISREKFIELYSTGDKISPENQPAVTKSD